MKTGQVIKISLLAVALLALIGVAPLVWLFTAGLRAPARVPAPDYWPTNGWRTSTPEEQGFDSAKLAEGLQDIRAREIDIDSLLIIRNGYVILDAHFYPYDGSFPHDLASVTKSVMTTLIAIAADQGKLDLDAPVVSFFPDRAIANLDERKAQLTVQHLTRMVGGLDTNCEDDHATIVAMTSNPDWVQAALDRPMISEPGAKFCYDSPGMHLLSAILQEATGMTALEFARQNLFEPLGIHEATWEVDPQGYTRGWGDLHLLPEDAAKIGYLWLHRGQWGDKQIVPEAWVLDSVKAHKMFVGDDIGYGNGWWISPANYYASGRGGQKIHVIALRNTVVVTAGAYFEYDDINEWLQPLLVRANKPLPANPQAQAALDAALAAAGHGPVASTTDSSPKIAQMISGKTFRCADNSVGLKSMRVDFDNPAAATLSLDLVDTDYVWPIGLDGHYRISPEGAGMRGYWKDSQTFLLETFDIGIVNRQMEVDGDRLQFSLPDAGLTVTCQAQEP
ncbi:MAG TPA: serine hydrolase [Anaerolineales bacterium]|nr:serine hydrolase [Anaerolineales bacterium]